jgi:hypothetical protein
MSKETVEELLKKWRDQIDYLNSGDAMSGDDLAADQMASKVTEAAEKAGIDIQVLVPDESERAELLESATRHSEADDGWYDDPMFDE